MHAVLNQNLSWALAYNVAAVPLAALGFVPPWLAAIGMSASSLVVVLNSLRIGSPHDARKQAEPVVRLTEAHA
jgi:Cu2+-exporting ATPase